MMLSEVGCNRVRRAGTHMAKRKDIKQRQLTADTHKHTQHRVPVCMTWLQMPHNTTPAAPPPLAPAEETAAAHSVCLSDRVKPRTLSRLYWVDDTARHGTARHAEQRTQHRSAQAQIRKRKASADRCCAACTHTDHQRVHHQSWTWTNPSPSTPIRPLPRLRVHLSGATRCSISCISLIRPMTLALLVVCNIFLNRSSPSSCV